MTDITREGLIALGFKETGYDERIELVLNYSTLSYDGLIVEWGIQQEFSTMHGVKSIEDLKTLIKLIAGPKKATFPKKIPNIPFEDFWRAYAKSSDKEKCKKKWNDILTDEERMLAMADIPKYFATLSDLKYKKMPMTYLNGKCWNDRIGEVFYDAPEKGRIQQGLESTAQAAERIRAIRSQL